VSRLIARLPGTRTNPRRTAYRIDFGERVLGYVVDSWIEPDRSLPILDHRLAPASRRWVPELHPSPAAITNAVRLEAVGTLGRAMDVLARASGVQS